MYLGFQGLRLLCQALPLGIARALGRALGAAAYAVLGPIRRLTQEHLAYAFGPSLTASDRRRITRGVFGNLGQNMVEWLQLPRWSAQRLQALVAAEGLDHLRQALSRGRGAILLTAHFGNWELIPLYLRGLGFEGGVLARRLRYPEYESFLLSMRGEKGVPTFARGSLKEVAKVLRANQIIGMLPDQDMDSLDGVFVEFFGHPAYTPVGPAALAVMTGAPILPCFLVRDGASFRLVIEPPVEAPERADRAQTMTALTQAWSRVMESRIRRHPDQWVWMHRRWKTKPTTDNRQPAPAIVAGGPGQAAGSVPTPPLGGHLQPVLSLFLLFTAYCLLLTGSLPSANAAAAAEGDQQMSGFTMTGYREDGTKQWEMEGTGAHVDGDIITIRKPDAIGYDPARTAYLTASSAQMHQKNRHVRMEHDVTIHTADGLWFTSPVLHWMPDQDRVATDQPVRLETDHMLLLGRGMDGLTQLKQVTILKDIEMVLNPSDHDIPGEPVQHVTITCDGPLTFDYEKNIATFKQNVHVVDPNGELFSDTLIAYLDSVSHTIRYAEAIDNVRIIQHQNTAYSDRAVYEPAIGKITLVGRPSLLVYPSEGQGSSSFAFDALTPAGTDAAPAAHSH